MPAETLILRGYFYSHRKRCAAHDASSKLTHRILAHNVELTGGTRQAALARRRTMREVPWRRAKDGCRGTSG
jgi:hypothetical protein